MILNETSYFGKGAINEVTQEINKRGFKNILIVTDKELVKIGLTKKVTQLLDQEKIAYNVFDGIVPNPSIEDVQAGVAFAKESKSDCLIAIGGGSPIDTAKAIGIIITNPEFEDVDRKSVV